MRSNSDFIEVTGATNGKKFLVNKSAIIFVTKADNDENAIILTKDGDHMHKILTKEDYKSVSEEILWNGEYRMPPFGYWTCSSDTGLKAPEKEEADD